MEPHHSSPLWARAESGSDSWTQRTQRDQVPLSAGKQKVADLSAPATFAPERVRRAFPGVGREGRLAWHDIGVSAFEMLATLAPYCCVVSKHGMRVPEPSQGLALCESREQKKQGQGANWREKNLSRCARARVFAFLHRCACAPARVQTWVGGV